jgi:hypothetical protein
MGSASTGELPIHFPDRRGSLAHHRASFSWLVCLLLGVLSEQAAMQRTCVFLFLKKVKNIQWHITSKTHSVL